RAGFLAAADGVALRFRNLGSSVEGFDQASQSAIDDSINKANSLLQQLAAINKQLANRGSAAEQPMQLLDKRDALLGDLAEQIGVTVSLSDNGGVTVYAGESASGAALVEGSAARTISVTFDELDPGRVQFVLDAQSRPTALPPIRSGIAGGLVSYRSQALGTVVDRLDALALAFGNAVNALHRQGLDAEGRAGGDLFYVGPAFDVQSGANAGTARLGVEIIDASKVAARGYDAKYDEARSLWIVTDIHSNASASGSAAVELDGLRFTFNGGAQAGDSFRIRPSQRPAMTFSTLIREPEEIVTGMRLSIAGALGNLSGISADVSLSGQREATAFRSLSDVLPRGSATGGAATSFARSSKPIAVIESGMRSVVLRSESPGSELAIFTRDGRQIAGPRTGAAVVTVANGFHAGAQYADTYLNRSGSGAYLDQGFIYGTHAVAGAQLDTDGRAVLTPAQLLTGRIDVSAFSQLNSGALRINGVSVATKIPRDGQPNTVVEYAAALNALRASTGVQAQVKSEIRVAVPVTNDPFSVSINGRSFSSATVSGLLAAINADPGLPTIEARLESAATSSLDGRALKPEIVIADTGGSDIALGSNNLGLAPGAYGAQLEFKTYQQVAVTSSAVPISASLTVNGVTIERTAPAGETASQRASGLAAKINAAAIGVQAEIVGSDLVLRNIDSQAGSPFTVGANNVGIEAAEYFDDSPLTIDFDPQVVGASSASLRQLGIQPGFVMDSALAEDLLVFGVDGSGEAAAISLSGSFDTGTPPANLASDRRQYVLTFAEANSYTITDSDTGTAVASGVFDLAERKISYGTWQVTLGGIPANGDAFTVSPNADPRGDNRMAAAIARLQDN
ncbi:MAG: FlgK family flagellar hook-associated protein, partial [Steroidobacteraceae bacterium]